MQQAPRKTHSPVQDLPSRTIRLVRGSSRQAASWLLQAGPGGTQLSIGAGPRCEWRIRAAGVPEQALWLMLTELGLYARAHGDTTVRIDGRALPSDWMLVSPSARIDIGMATLTVSAAEPLQLDTIEAPVPDPDPDPDPDQSGMRPTPAPAPAAPPRNSLSVWRFSRASLPDAPSVLGRYAPPVDKTWLYVVTGLTLAGYATWVAFLE